MSESSQGVGIYSGNRYYWTRSGAPVLLLGGSPRAEGPNDVGVFHLPNLAEYLDALVAVGGNWQRCLMSGQHSSNRWPFARVGDRFDLDQWSEEYWDRFELFLKEGAARGIITDCELWATFDYYLDTWSVNPFNPANNVNYSAESTGLPTVVATAPHKAENPFFWTVPDEHNLTEVLRYQQRFVDRILSHTLRYHHVLYCMDNETSGEEAWGAYWADHIHQRAREAGKQVCVTEMWDAWDLKSEEHKRTLDHPERYDFADVSQNNQKKGQEHWDNFQWVYNRIAKQPRPPARECTRPSKRPRLLRPRSRCPCSRARGRT